MGLLSRSFCLAVLANAVNVAAQSSISAQDATAFALTYGYPLLAYEKVRLLVNLTGGPNTWYHFRQLQTPVNKAVVKPNVDTLYSALVYDISQADLLVSIPAGIPDSQFHLISFFDPFGTNYDNVGTLNTNTAGTYRLQPRTVGTTPQIASGNETVVGTVETTSLYGFLLIRWLVNNTNLDALHEWQDQTLNSTVPATVRGPALATLPVIDGTKTPVDNILRLLPAFAPYTLPDSTINAENVTRTLAIAGISNGTYTAQSNVDLNQANQTAVTSAMSAAAAPSAVIAVNNGWIVANASLIGIYDDNYAFRAAVASGGYLAIKAPNAIYPNWSNGSSSTPLGGDFELGPNEALVLTFSSQPPLLQSGFWSLTAYQNNYLIANQYNVYAIASERSNITYADGSAVIGSTSNQTFQLLVQPSDIVPPSNWTSNFLPGPAGGGSMELTLRLYGAQQSLLDGEWQYPVVSRQAAIGARSSGSTATASGSPTSTSMSKPSSTSTSTVATYTGAAATQHSSFVLVAAACLLAAAI